LTARPLAPRRELRQEAAHEIFERVDVSGPQGHRADHTVVGTAGRVIHSVVSVGGIDEHPILRNRSSHKPPVSKDLRLLTLDQINQLNPWWTKPTWTPADDMHLATPAAAPFQWDPRPFEADDPSSGAVFTLRGLRQSGSYCLRPA
jgi:hypothetical protein